jgi:hypothetical protein
MAALEGGRNFLPTAVFLWQKENRMNSNQVRSNDMVLDGWPILVAFALYLVAFGIVAMTMAAGMLVA